MKSRVILVFMLESKDKILNLSNNLKDLILSIYLQGSRMRSAVDLAMIEFVSRKTEVRKR